jgi:hypothetical protein
MIYLIPIIRYASQDGRPVGAIVTTASMDAEIAAPKGFLHADGQTHLRGHYPELAPLCKQYTHWFRWHVLRQFNTPYVAVSRHGTPYEAEALFN